MPIINNGLRQYSNATINDIKLPESANSGEEGLKERESLIQHQVNVENADDKFTAAVNTWDDTYLANSIDWFSDNAPFLFDKPDEYMSGQTDEQLRGIMQQNNIPPKYYQQLKEAKTREQQGVMLNTFYVKEYRKKYVDDHLNGYNPTAGIFSEKSTAALTTGILGDIDTLTIPLGIGIYSKLGKTAAILSTTSAHVATASMAYANNPDISATEASVFGSLGIVADGMGIAFMKSKKGVKSVLDNELRDTVEERAMDDATINDVHKTATSNVSIPSITKKLDATQVEASRLTQIIDEVKKDGTPTKRAVKAQERLNELGYNKKPSDEINAKVAKLEADNALLAKKAKEDEKFFKELESKKLELKKLTAERKAIQNKLVKNIQASKKARESSGFAHIKDSKIAEALSWEKKYNKAEVASIKNDINWFKRTVSELPTQIKNGVRSAKTTSNEILQRIDSLHNNGFITKKERQQIRTAIRTGKIDTIEKFSAKFKRTKDGKYELVPRKGMTNKTKLIVAGAMLMGADSLFADDGINAVSVGLGGIALVAGLVAIANPQVFKSIYRASKTSLKKFSNRGYIDNVEKTVNAARLSFMESFTPLVADKNKEFVTMAQDLLWDSFDGIKNVGETIKTNIYHSEFKVLEGELQQAYGMWLKENGQGVFKRFKNILALGLTERQKFDILAMDAVEGLTDIGESKALQTAVNEIRKTKSNILTYMKEAGVEGADKIMDDAFYMPRRVRPTIALLTRELKSMAADGVTSEFEKLVTNFSELIKGDRAVEKARVYLNMISDSGTSKNVFESIESVQKALDDMGVDKSLVSAADVADMFGIRSNIDGAAKPADVFKSTKHRIDLDFSKWKDIKLNASDGEITVTLDHIFVRQATELMNGFVNQASGYIALAKKGYTPAKAIEIAKKSAKNSDTMLQVIDDILGVPLFDGSTTTSKVMRDFANYSTAMVMSFSSLTLAGEALKLATNINKSGFLTAIKQIASKITLQGDTELVANLRHGTGMGIHKDGLTFGQFNSITDENLLDGTYRTTSGGKMFTKVGQLSRDAILYPMVTASDFLTSVAMSKNAQLFLDLSEGITKVHPDRLAAFGIDDYAKSVAKKYLHKNSIGEIKPIDWNSMTIDEKLTMQKVLFNMNQKDIMLTTMGGTPSWSRGSELGAAISHLMKFPMAAYANHGLFDIKGIAKGDFRSFMNQSMWFMGAMVTNMVKSEITGKKLSDEDLVLRSLYMMPLAGVPSVMSGLTNPAIFGAMSNVDVATQVIYGN